MNSRNILEFDDPKSIRAYNFTLTAMKKFYDIIESEQFREESGQTIFEYLNGVMELVSFKEQLKRFVYVQSGTKEAYNEVDYVQMILKEFEKNGCVDSSDTKSLQELRRKVKRWVGAESVKRENMFQIGYGLSMDDKKVTEFLTLVLKETDFDFYDPEESIHWYCLHNGKSRKQAEYIKEWYEKVSGDDKVREDHLWEAMRNDPKMYLGTEEGLKKYLNYLKNLNVAEKKESKAREVFGKLYRQTQQVVAEHLNRYPDVNGKKAEPSEINPAKIESVLYSGVEVTDTGNLMPFDKLKKQFKSKRLNRARLNGVLGGKMVERFDIITLAFLIFALDETKLNLCEGERFSEFVEHTNDLLADAGMLELYPVNPYEAFVLMCIVSEDPLDTFASVWENSYEDGE